MIYVFVEGPDDENFISKVFEKIILSKYNYYQIIAYSGMGKDKIKKFITSVEKQKNVDYIFIADSDGKKDKLDKIMEEKPYLNRDKTFISFYEVESWILAGISDKVMKKCKIKKFINTENITKEMFNNMIPKGLFRNEFISFILDDYNLDDAIKKNNSLKCFYQYIKKAS